MRTAFVSALLAAAVTCVAAPKATAQEQRLAQVDSALARIKRALGPTYSEAQQQMTRQFYSDPSPKTESWQPTRGSYVILAAGEERVAGIVLRLIGPDSAVVSADTSGSTTPRINLTAPVHGTRYRLVYAPTNCSQFPCYVGLQIMQRR
jgi:hypothetical protein